MARRPSHPTPLRAAHGGHLIDGHPGRVGIVRQGVVVVTWYGGGEPLRLLLKSLDGCAYPIYVVVNGAHNAITAWLDVLREQYTVLLNDEDRFELGAISAVLERTDLDEFILLQDTFEVKDQTFLDICFARPESVALGPTFFHYAGKWKRSVLEQMTIPVVTSKQESIHWEHTFSRLYWERESVWVFDAHFHDGEHQGFVEAFGRTNMLLENEYYRKRKGTWA